MRAPPLDLADQLICSSGEDGEAVGDRLILQNIKHGVVLASGLPGGSACFISCCTIAPWVDTRIRR
jgi:hypothetical protein